MCVYYDFIAEGFSLFCRLAKLDFYLSGSRRERSGWCGGGGGKLKPYIKLQ